MRKEREELKRLRKELIRLTDMIEHDEIGSQPCFYRCFDSMRNNIDIFIYAGEEDLADFFPVLERDWLLSMDALTWIQEYGMWEDTDPEKPDPEAWICFVETVCGLDRFFQTREKDEEKQIWGRLES